MRLPLLSIVIVIVASSAPAACPPRGTENFDAMRSPLLPTGWVASQGVNVTGAPLWVTSNVASHSLPNAAFSTAPDNVLDNRLDTPASLADSFGPGITFWSSYNLQSGRDGAVLEISTPAINGGAFTDITDPAVGGSIDPPYNSVISSAFQSPIAGRMAWSGNSGGFVFTRVTYGNLTVPLPEIRFRFRLVSDNSGASEGWRIDAVTFLASECNPPTPPPTPTASPAPTATATPIASPCGSPNVIADSTFEAGTPWSSWTVQTSTNFGTPLCNTAACGTAGGSPYSGDNWVWFGGANVPETATLGQSVTITAGATATLSFLMQKRNISGPTTDVLNVRVDGTIVQSYGEAGPFELAYSLRSIDLSAFADGGSHLILFEYIGPSTSLGSYLVDNITLTFGPTCPTPTPLPTVTPSATVTPTPSPTVTAPPTPSPTPSAAPTPSLVPAQALNISTRVRVETGERVMIGGFIITGSGPKKVAIRGLGPSLAHVGLSGILLDPTLELRGSGGALILQNDNWQDNPAQAGELTALGLALADPREPGIVATLDPGAYTAIIAGKNQTSGIALVEIYDAEPAAASRLANISTRGFVQSGDDVMIGGFILGKGDGTATVAVRGLGPSLGQLGLNDVLADPTLELRDGNGMLMVANDNWQDDSDAAAQLTAQGLAPNDPLEPGILATVPPGLFTAILAGKNGSAGVGLLEVYGNVHPATIIVTSRLTNGPGTVYQALLDVPNGGVIQFDPSLYGTTLGQNSMLVIDKNIVLRGPGPDQLTLAFHELHLSVIMITPGHSVTIEGLTISGGNARLGGGGIRSDGDTLVVNDCVVESNTSEGPGAGISHVGQKLTILSSIIRHNSITGAFNPIGGGIYGAGTMEIRNSTISGNYVGNSTIAPGAGGGIGNVGILTIVNSTISGNSASHGAGIASFGPLAITNSTISGNTALAGVQGVGNSGGGIYNGFNSGPLTITNSTISGNSAAQASGIGNGATLTITNTTISGNQGDPGDGSIYNAGSLEIGNSILKAGPSGSSIVGTGTVVSHGYNLSSDNGGGLLTGPGDQINTNPMLGPLRNNGGPTFTHGLLSGSPAINTGTPDSTPPPAYDQRGPGYPRVINGQIDIGSFEVQPAAIPTPTPGFGE